MRINNNLMAMNTHRQLGIAQGSGAKSMEKLSSGFRINRAGDDAAGLAISEKMRGQIRGLNQASRNAQDGISMIQTAEGALNETHAILQRMRELAVQSATDTNTNEDRAELQKEVDQLANEITRIADTTEFNTQNLLGGDLDVKFHIGANAEQNIGLAIEAMDAGALEVAGEADGDMTYVLDATAITAGSTGDDNAGSGGAAVTFEEGTYTIVSVSDFEGDAGLTDGSVEGAVADVTQYLVDGEGNIVGTGTAAGVFHAVGDATIGQSGDGDAGSRSTFTVAAGATEVEIDAANTGVTVTYAADFAEGQSLADGTYTVVDDGGLQLQNAAGETVATSADGAAWLDMDGEALMTTNTLSAGDEIEVGGAAGGIDISSQEAADTAITTINDAIETVSAERSKLGALQNRLEHTISNLDNASENLQAAESRIRDVDMAQEMMELTKQNILQQASTAMLAQANQAPQSVLQLLG